MEITSNIEDVLMSNYLPYAKGIITHRAIPAIDGFKPANRKILYTMYKLGLLHKDKQKSTRIVGDAMKYHPHGDATIYDTMVRMTTGNQSLNVPYIESKGNFGKVWSKSMAYAASRYTEAKLASVCEELFDGLDENAVEMIDNFDNSEKEPYLLPVKFPTVLVNTSGGIAVGYASNVAPFSLNGVCKGTIAMLDGSATNPYELMEIVGPPEFPTGGYIHNDKKELLRLGTYGRGTFIVSGAVNITDDNKIIITNIPYDTNVENIIDTVKAHMKDELKEVSSIKDLSDIEGLSVQITIKRGNRARQVLKKINRITNLRMKVTFNNAVIVNGRCRTLGVYDLLNEWIAFRLKTVRRVYEFRVGKKEKQVHLLEAWEKVAKDITDVAKILSSNKEEDAKKLLMEKYSLDDLQSEYFLDIKIRMLTQNRLEAKLKELEEVKNELHECKLVAESEEERKSVVIRELKEIMDKYGSDRKCIEVEPIELEEDKPKEVVIEDYDVNVVITKKLKIKKLKTANDIIAFKTDPSDPEVLRLHCNNTEDLLIYTYGGMCYKIKVNDIDDTRGIPKEHIFSLVNKSETDDGDVLYITNSGDYSGALNIIYPNGKGKKIPFSAVSGNRKVYKSQFDTSFGKVWATESNEVFLITKGRKAAYADLNMLMISPKGSSFRITRLHGNEEVFGIQPAERVPNIEEIDLERYSKGYTVLIKNDKLW